MQLPLVSTTLLTTLSQIRRRELQVPADRPHNIYRPEHRDRWIGTDTQIVPIHTPRGVSPRDRTETHTHIHTAATSGRRMVITAARWPQPQVVPPNWGIVQTTPRDQPFHTTSWLACVPRTGGMACTFDGGDTACSGHCRATYSSGSHARHNSSRLHAPNLLIPAERAGVLPWGCCARAAAAAAAAGLEFA